MIQSDDIHTFRIGEHEIWFHSKTLEVSTDPLLEPATDNSATIIANNEFSGSYPDYKTLGLILTNECNLRCSYCFERILLGEPSKQVMSPATAKKAIDFYFSWFQGSFPSILLFGGEPMLWWKNIPDLIKYGNEVALFNKKKIEWQISTNGTFIPPDAINFFKEQRMNFFIDIDGNKNNHNTYRPFASGAGSYDIILKNYEHLRALKGSTLSLRATATPQYPFVFELYKNLSVLGPDNIFIYPCYFESDTQRWDKPPLEDLLRGYTLLAEHTLNLIQMDNYHDVRSFPFIFFLYNLCAREKKRNYCGAYGGLIAVSPEGILYPCIALENQEEYCMGDLGSGINRVSHCRWKELCIIEQRAGCKDCWARYLCGGGCISHMLLTNGQNGPPVEFECALIRHLAELSIWLYLEIIEKKPGFFVNFISKDKVSFLKSERV